MASDYKKRRAETIIKFYRDNYSVPFWESYRDGTCKETGRWATRLYDFKIGLAMSSPHSGWHRRLNKVDIEVKKQICPEEDDIT